MTVKELKTVLENLPDDMIIFTRIHGWNSEFDQPESYEDQVALAHVGYDLNYITSEGKIQKIERVLILESLYPEEY